MGGEGQTAVSKETLTLPPRLGVQPFNWFHTLIVLGDVRGLRLATHGALDGFLSKDRSPTGSVPTNGNRLTEETVLVKGDSCFECLTISTL